MVDKAQRMLHRILAASALTMQRWSRKVPAPILCFIGLVVSFYGNKEQLRQFAYLINRSEYSRAVLVVTGTTEKVLNPGGDPQYRMSTLLGHIDGQHLEVDARSLGYSPLWVFQVFDYSLLHRPEAELQHLRDHFPAEMELPVLRCQDWGFPVNYVHPYILCQADYGELTWLGFLRTILIWNCVLLYGVYCAVSRSWQRIPEAFAL